MNMQYKNMKELEIELKTIELKRNIDIEQLKIVKHQFSSQLKPYRILYVGYKAFRRYGVFFVLRKFLK